MVKIKTNSSFPEIVMAMRENCQAFLAVCEALTQEQALIGGICGEWSAKAVVDHLTGWQLASPSFLKGILSSENPILDLDIDAFNQISVQARQALSWKDSLAAFKISFAAFEGALAEIPNAQFKANVGIKSWVKAMNHEYVFHRIHIRKAQER